MKTPLIRCALAASLGLVMATAVAQGQSTANAQKTFKGYALADLGASGLLYDPKTKSAYMKALGPLAKEPWLSKLDGPSPQNRPVKVANNDFVLIAACKNRDCEQNSAVLLWSSPDTIYGKVVQRGKSSLIGAPPPAVASELEKLWKTEWRSQAR
jgi:hypothetical protein